MIQRPSLILFALLAFLTHQHTRAQDIDVILKKHYRAVGQSNFESIRTVRVEVTEVDGFGKGQIYEMVKKSPDKIRLEGTNNGTPFVTVFDGDTAWTCSPGVESTFRYLDQRTENILLVRSIIGSPLVLGQKQGFYLEINRSVYVDRRATYVFRLDFPDGLFIDFFVDKKDFMIKKMVSYMDNSGEEIDQEVNYTNYRNLGSFIFPFKFEWKNGTNPSIDVIVGEVAVGVGASADLFETPNN